jgi:hypothetical protein
MAKYYALQVCSFLYKALSVITVILVLGAIGTMLPGMTTLPALLASALPLAVGGGLLAFTFFVLAQLIDLQTTNTRSIQKMVDELQQFRETVDKYKQTDQVITAAIDRQNRLLTILARDKNISLEDADAIQVKNKLSGER